LYTIQKNKSILFKKFIKKIRKILLY